MTMRHMPTRGCPLVLLATAAMLGLLPADATPRPGNDAPRIAPAAMPAVAKVDERFQSYNVEMVELVGGRFWAPYPKPGAAPVANDGRPSGGVDVAAAMFRKREPLELKHDRRLRTLAKALGPSYVRVSGAWANSIYFHDSDAPAPDKAPAGYESVMTRPQWAGLVDFARASDARIVASFAVSAGARDASGTWNPDQAQRLARYTKSLGSSIYAAELINEPNVGPMVGLPKGYDAATFARDIAAFQAFAKTTVPQIRTVGPGSTGEAGFMLFPLHPGVVATDALMTAMPRPSFDIFSYHFYGTVSKRCSGMSPTAGIAADQALNQAWLARADTVFDYYKARRDRFMPGTAIWITEAAQAACGGDAWAATFLDTFRYVDQMGRLAKKGVGAVFHNTLSASDYALIDDVTLEPRPSYWAAVLWARLMGTTVLDAGAGGPELNVYAQCLRGTKGGVGLVAINLSKTDPAALQSASAGQRYTLTADQLDSGKARLNGRELAMVAGDRLPAISPVASAAGTMRLAPASITFLAFPRAGNPACR